MFSTFAPVLHHRNQSRFGRRSVGPVCALALAVLVAGNVAAIELERDNPGSAGVVTPGLDFLDLIQFKLRTTAGYNVLVFG